MAARVRGWLAWLLLGLILCNWTPLFSNQSGRGIELPEIVVLGQDRARLEGFRDFSLLPALVPGLKPEPVAGKLEMAAVQGAGPEWKTASGPAPGCAYRNVLTASLARGFGGLEAYYNSGRQKYLEGLEDEAAIYFSAGLEKYPAAPQAPDCHYWLGEIALHRRNYDAARRHFSAAAAAEKGRFYFYAAHALAWLDYRERRWEAAANWFAIAARSPVACLQSSAHLWRAESLLRLGRLEAGRKVLEKLAAGYPAAPEHRAALYRLATLAFNRRDYRTARRYLENLPASGKSDDILRRQADLALGWCCYFLQDYVAAAALFAGLEKRVAASDPVQPLAFLGRILTAIAQRRIDRALELYKQRPVPLKTVPAAAAAARRLLVALTVAGRRDEARELARELTGNYPPQLLKAEDFRFRAALEAAAGEPETALEVLKKGLALFAGRFSGMVSLKLEKARILLAVGRSAAALKLLDGLNRERSGIKVVADRDRFFLLYARALNREGRFSRTLELLRRLPPNSSREDQAALLYERGWAALKLGRYGEAVDDFRGFLNLGRDSERLRPLRDNAELNRVEALFNLHRDEEVKAQLEDFIRRRPQSPFVPRARNYLGLLAMRHGEFARAGKLFAAALTGKPAPDHDLKAEILYNLGESYFSREQFRKAIALYRKVADGCPDCLIGGRALIRIGESWFNLGEYLKSRVVYLQAKKAFPGGEIEEKAAYGMLLLAYNQDRYRYLEIEVKNFIRRFPDSEYAVPLLLLLLDLYQRQNRQVKLNVLLGELEAGDYPETIRLEAVFRHFRIEEQARKFAAAAALGERLLKEFPGSKYEPDCRLFLAQRAFAAGDYAAAGKWLGELPESCPDLVLRRRARLLAARINQAAGRPAAARRDYLKILEERRDDPPAFAACRGLARLLVGEGKIDEALFYFDRAAADPDHRTAARALLEKAASLEKAGRWRQALAVCLRLGYLFPEQRAEVTEALLRALALARAGKEKETADRVRQKLAGCKLSPEQQRRLEKLR